MDAVWASVTKLYGEVGASLTGLTLINFDVKRKIAVIRVSLVALNDGEGFLGCSYRVAGKEASVHVLAVSGTLKALYSNLK